MKARNFTYIIIALLILLSGNCYCQFFEGKMTYKVEIDILPDMEKMGITKSLIEDQLRLEGLFSEFQDHIYSKSGSFCIKFDSSNKLRSIYRPDSNKVYSLNSSSDTCSILDVSIDLESVLIKKVPQIIELDTIVSVFNKSCKVIRIKWQTGYYDYAYHKDMFVVNPTSFQNYIYDGWANFITKSGCLPLKITKVTKGMMSITYTLVGFKEERINDAEFIIPKLVLIDNSILNQLQVINKKLAIIKSN